MGFVGLPGCRATQQTQDTTTRSSTQRFIGLPVSVVSTRAVEVQKGQAELVVDLTPDLHGTLELHEDGSYTYTPAPNFNGTRIAIGRK